MGHSQSWTPRQIMSQNRRSSECDTTAAAIPCGVMARTTMYTGTSCGVEVSKSVQFLMLRHLYSHRAGANVSMRQRGSRVARGRARTVLSRLIAAVRAWATAASANATLPIATRIDPQLAADLVSEDPKPGVRRGKQTKFLSSIVAVKHWIFRLVS